MVSARLLIVLLASTGQMPAEETQSASARLTPIEQRPYKIRALVSFDPSTRIDEPYRARIVDAWRTLGRRWVGPAWEVEATEPDGPTSALVLEDVSAPFLKPHSGGVDKVWLIQGRAVGGEILLSGREFDVATGWLGSLHERKVTVLTDLSRELFRLSEGLFAPYAEIGEPVGDMVPLRVQGSALSNGSGRDPIAPEGAVFRPVRVYFRDDGSILDVQKVLYSYLRVESRDGPITRSTLIRGVRDPLSKRVVRKNRLIALGIKPAAFPTRLRFVQRPDQSPGAGYLLTCRPAEKGLAREIATTDRQGRVTLPPGFATDLVILRLVAGKSEPMVELPIMPGETSEELTIAFDPKPLTIALESQLESLRDSIIDLVAVRSRLERRMKARETGDDWNGVEETLAEFRTLPGRDGFSKRLERLQEDALQQETRSKSLILTKTARAQLTETRGLIDRYLDDEVFRAYEDAAVRAKDRDARVKETKSIPKLPPRPTSVPPADKPTNAPVAPKPSSPGSVPF